MYHSRKRDKKNSNKLMESSFRENILLERQIRIQTRLVVQFFKVMVWKIKELHKDRDQKEKKESNQLLQTYVSIKDWTTSHATHHTGTNCMSSAFWDLNAWQEFSTLLGKNIYLCSTQSTVSMNSLITIPKGFPTTSAKLELNHSEAPHSLGNTQHLFGTAFSKD